MITITEHPLLNNDPLYSAANHYKAHALAHTIKKIKGAVYNFNPKLFLLLVDIKVALLFVQAGKKKNKSIVDSIGS